MNGSLPILMDKNSHNRRKHNSARHFPKRTIHGLGDFHLFNIHVKGFGKGLPSTGMPNVNRSRLRHINHPRLSEGANKESKVPGILKRAYGQKRKSSTYLIMKRNKSKRPTSGRKGMYKTKRRDENLTMNLKKMKDLKVTFFEDDVFVSIRKKYIPPLYLKLSLINGKNKIVIKVAGNAKSKRTTIDGDVLGRFKEKYNIQKLSLINIVKGIYKCFNSTLEDPLVKKRLSNYTKRKVHESKEKEKTNWIIFSENTVWVKIFTFCTLKDITKFSLISKFFVSFFDDENSDLQKSFKMEINKNIIDHAKKTQKKNPIGYAEKLFPIAFGNGVCKKFGLRTRIILNSISLNFASIRNLASTFINGDDKLYVYKKHLYLIKNDSKKVIIKPIRGNFDISEDDDEMISNKKYEFENVDNLSNFKFFPAFETFVYQDANKIKCYDVSNKLIEKIRMFKNQKGDVCEDVFDFLFFEKFTMFQNKENEIEMYDRFKGKKVDKISLYDKEFVSFVSNNEVSSLFVLSKMDDEYKYFISIFKIMKRRLKFLLTTTFFSYVTPVWLKDKYLIVFGRSIQVFTVSKSPPYLLSSFELKELSTFRHWCNNKNDGDVINELQIFEIKGNVPILVLIVNGDELIFWDLFKDSLISMLSVKKFFGILVKCKGITFSRNAFFVLLKQRLEPKKCVYHISKLMNK